MEIQTKFYVNEEKGIVICKLFVQECCDSFEFVGKAVCSPEDTFDEITGRRIAETKAHIKLHRNAAKTSLHKYEKLTERAGLAMEELNNEVMILLSLEDKLMKLTSPSADEKIRILSEKLNRILGRKV